MTKRWLGALTLVTGGALFGLEACGDDSVTGDGPDASVEASPLQDSGPSVDANDSAVDRGIQTFTVPAAGGSVEVQGQSMKIGFTFPASAAGKVITFELGTAGDTGFPAGAFSDVIKLGPGGLRFSDVVVVKPEKKNLVGAILSFAETGMKKGPASAVIYNAESGAYELRHFSALVIVPPNKVCETETFQDVPSNQQCAGDASVFRRITCQASPYCVLADRGCCVDPNVDSGTGCAVEDHLLSSLNPATNNGGTNPWCDGDAGRSDGGVVDCFAGFQWKTNGGCFVHAVCGNDFVVRCDDGATCRCIEVAGPAGEIAGKSFAQGTTCDNSATMWTAYVQQCGYPTRSQ